jgi:predicted DNA repair protein MutK
MTIQSDVYALTNSAATRIQLTNDNLSEVLSSFSTFVGAFVKGEQTCIVHRLRIGLWVWKDAEHTQKDVGRIDDLLCLFCKTYTVDELGEKVWTQGEIKLLAQTQFDIREFKELVTPSLQDTFTFL